MVHFEEPEHITQVKPGDKGIEVAYYQVMLRDLYDTKLGNSGPAHDGIDGVYSPAMQKAVREVQTSHQMTRETGPRKDIVPLTTGAIDAETGYLIVSSFCNKHRGELTYSNGQMSDEIKALLHKLEPSLTAIEQAKALGSPAAPHVKHVPVHPSKTPPDQPAPPEDVLPYTIKNGRRVWNRT